MKRHDKTPDIYRLFVLMEKADASDIHLKEGRPPIMRIQGRVEVIDEKPLSSTTILKTLHAVIDDDRKREFHETGDLDIALPSPSGDRYRLSVFRQRGATSIAMRRVTAVIPDFKMLRLPDGVQSLADTPQGLVIVSGPTGSGKSTTLARMIQHINTSRSVHIVTIEDPIEYLFADDKSFINQREIGVDVADFDAALKHVVRHDPDVILIGEMRDRETFEAALTASETGHLVFGSLHSATVAQTFGRILDLFPGNRHEQISHSLAFNLKGMVCQRIMQACEPPDTRVPACEILISTPSIRKLIHNMDFAKIPDAIRMGHGEGMLTLNMSLAKLFEDGTITKKVALEASPNEEELQMMLKGIDVSAQGGILGAQ